MEDGVRGGQVAGGREMPKLQTLKAQEKVDGVGVDYSWDLEGLPVDNNC